MKKEIFRALLLLFGVLILSSRVLADINEGLVAYYPFNGNANDESGNDNHATVVGPAFTEDRLGNPNSAYVFNGTDDHIIVADDDSLDLTTHFTFSAWIKSYDNSDRRVIFSKWDDNLGDWSYIFKKLNWSDTLNVALSEGGHHDLAEMASINTIPVGEWIHVAATYDSMSLKLFINGVEDSSIVAAGTIHNSATPLLIGAVFTGGGIQEHFSGLIDEVRIYNRTLSAWEIQQLYLGNEQEEVSQLTLGVAQQATVRPQNFNFYSLELEAGKSLLVQVTPQSGINKITLDGKLGGIEKSPGNGSFTTNSLTPRSNYELIISPTASGTYYFSVFGYDVDAGGGSYSIKTEVLDGQYLSDISPRLAGSGGTTTLTLSGLGFDQATQVSLTKGSSTPVTSSSTQVASSTRLFATFNLVGAEPGLYQVKIDHVGQLSSTLSDALEVSGASPASLSVSAVAPPLVRVLSNYIFWLQYGNDGGSDMPAQLFVVSNDAGAKMRLSNDEPFREGNMQVLGIRQFGPAGTLPPQSSYQIPVYFKVPSGASQINFTLEKMIADGTAIDWASIENDVKPADMDPDGWAAIWANLKAQLGSTWAQYLQRLDDDATYLSNYRRFWSRNISPIWDDMIIDYIFPLSTPDTGLYDVRTLLQFEFAKASAGMSPRSVLAAAQDLYVPGPGLPLTFGRFAPQSIANRFRLGPLGRGWTHTYEYSATTESSGDITIKGPGGATRIFYSLGDGSYQPTAGDHGSVSVAGGDITLREKDGMVWTFSGGALASIADTNGNTLSLAYSGDLLTQITHSNGEKITLGYNGSGRLGQVTDPSGRAVLYRYDAGGEHLSEVEKPGGIITSYSYHAADGTPSAHALTTITFPDATHYYYAFDAQGRLAEEWEDDNVGHVTYGYDDQGTVTVTDALGQTATILFGRDGEVLQVEDPLGALTTNRFDTRTQLVKLTGPDGKNISFGYDAKGNPARITNPLYQQVKMSFEPDRSRLTNLTDARSNETQFGYDASGNLKTITYPDASAESFNYDGSGNIQQYQNRRSQHITFNHNLRGQITRKTYPDGRTIDYSYDAKGNLTTAADSLTGTIAMQYDDRDFLSRIEYPDGYWFTFEYNNAGQRTKRSGHDGAVLNYQYDANGRLEKLTDGAAAEIIRYEYDENGRLKKEIKGNGTQTTYEYDAAGQLLHMVNYGPGGAVQSRFDYTYDVNGNRTSMTTLDGTTSYQYDAIGQLTGVTYPGGRQQNYVYDAAGNRVSETNSGITTNYTTNNMNQYTHVGDATYGYDTDGNMTSKSDAEGTTTYEYDAENRLIRVVTPFSGTWEYTYDALGNRIRVSHDGAVTRYVHDPMGLVDVAAEYNGSGGLVARYTHGLGLVATSDGAGGKAYYSFDAIGNTRQLTNASGVVMNSYDYEPFGVSLQADETVSNPFRYVGRFGVMEEHDRLKYMRFRAYLGAEGRFLQSDPKFDITVFGSNLYEYAYNAPINLADPLGLRPSNSTKTSKRKKKRLKSLTQNLDDAIEEIQPGYLIDDPREIRILMPEHEYPYEGIWWLPNTGPLPIPEPSNKEPVGQTTSGVVGSLDPNEKTGNPGIGDQHYITTDEELSYTVYFENKSTATAPAQEVFVTDYLDPDLDWSTLKLGAISFGSHMVSDLAGKEGGEAQTDSDPYIVTIEAQHIPGTSLIKWTLRTIDPETGELPEDPLAGFLPPEDGTGRGQGYVSFTIKPKSGLAEGTEIKNSATIIFDTEAPISTNEVFNIMSDGDGDNDGMSDTWEVQYFGDLSRDGTQDFDNDILSDVNEYLHNTNPTDDDSDDDGMKDGWEVANNLNPLLDDASDDADGDGYTNGEEYRYGTNPRDKGSKPIWKVDSEVPLSGDGAHWESAFKTLQEAVDWAREGDQIWVKAGVHALGVPLQVDKKVAVYGGFEGTEEQREVRNWSIHVTALDGQESAQCAVLSADAVLDGLVFSRCRADAGGAVRVTAGAPTMVNCRFRENHATEGGAIHAAAATLKLINCEFAKNTATSGGALYGAQAAVTINNCTFAGNSASFGGAIGNDSAGAFTITNSILWGDSPDEIDNAGGTVTATHSDIEVAGGYPGNGNMAEDPRFVDGKNGLLRLRPTSPCIDVGAAPGADTPELDLAGQPRIADGDNDATAIIDMGAYEYQMSAGIDSCGVYRRLNGLIYLKKENTTGFADASLCYGIAEDVPVAGDWDGDGVDGIGVYRNGQFYLKNTIETGYADMVFAFGQDGDKPVAGDWDGDGIDTIGVYRDGLFMLRNSNDSGPAEMVFLLGIPGDVPLAGNWDGSGGDSCGVFRPDNGLIFLKNENTSGYADVAITFGIENDLPVMGDWNGDGVDTIGVYRNGAFLLRNSNETGWAEMMFWLGVDGDVPISGKWGLP